MAQKVGGAMQPERQRLRRQNTFTRGHVGLIGVRAVWVMVGVCLLMLISTSLPAAYAHLQAPCRNPTCDVGQITVGNVIALHRLGLSVSMYALYPLLASLLTGGILFLVSLVIFWRRSDQWFPVFVSLWLLVCASVAGIGPASPLVPPQVMRGIAYGATMLAFCGLGIFCATFPNGRLAPGWSWLIPLLWVLQLLAFFAPGPFNITNWPGPLFPLEVLLVFASTLALQIYRYVRLYDAVERQQAKWLVYGLGIALLYLVCGIVLSALLPADSPVLLALLPVPLVLVLCLGLAVGAAIVRYRLWDIDLIIQRTLIYGVLSACVIGLYVLIVGYIGALFQTPNNSLISFIATALVAIVFQPLRSLLQRAANRLLYGERDAPYRMLARLDQQLALARPAEEVLPTLVKTIATALKLPYVAITLLHSDAATRSEERVVATHGQHTPHASTEHLPLVYQGETVGQLVFTARAGEAQLTTADRRVLEDLARHAGVIAHAVGLTADLRRSRERLVVAREEERRRLRRDLHDGLGPMMASLTLTLAAAREYLGRDPATADALLQEMAQHLQGAVGDIRRLVYELRPPTLDDLGLLGALREQATRYTQGGLRVTVEAPEVLDPLPAAVEVAAYRIAMEALTNVVRHAQASMGVLKIERNGNLLITISDDGCGLPATVGRGIGMRSMRERAEELGGTCSIEARPGGGTVVSAYFPLMEDEHEDSR
ncbi:MAG TPA: histidine kinase [Ktedonobacteraceae bacterium]